MAEKIIKMDPENMPRYLAAAVTAFQEGLVLAVYALADVKGTEDLSWFDKLREDAIRAAKGTITEEIPVDIEAGAIRFGFEALDAIFQSIRVDLVKRQ